MPSPAVSRVSLVASLRAAAERFAFAFLVLLSLCLMVVAKADPEAVARVRIATADLLAPVLRAIAEPARAVHAAGTRITEMVALYAENDRLRQENGILRQWQDVARRLDAENKSLRDLSRYIPSGASWSITAETIGGSGGTFSRNLLVDRGATDGVAKGQAALAGAGLVGRVAEVGQRAARILLLTDLNSRIPVILEASRERAILAGDNSDWPMLVFLGQSAAPAVGDRLVTSGDGGVFPPGIPVGIVSSVGGQVRVEPVADLARIDYVRLMDFGLSGVLPERAVPLPKSPPPSRGRPRANE